GLDEGAVRDDDGSLGQTNAEPVLGGLQPGRIENRPALHGRGHGRTHRVEQRLRDLFPLERLRVFEQYQILTTLPAPLSVVFWDWSSGDRRNRQAAGLTTSWTRCKTSRRQEPFMRHIFASLVILLLISTSAHAQRGRGGAPAAPADGGPDGLGALHFRPLGPEGNRVAAITGVPGDAMTVYIGAADGGIWKTADAGITWRPIFDDKDVSAVGALAVAPSAHDTVWAGTGEPWLIRPYYTLGDGVYKSTDAGRTWQHMGLDATGHIARIVIDPGNANSVYVCAI